MLMNTWQPHREISYSAAEVATTRMQLMWWMVNHQLNVNKLDALALIHPRPAKEGVAEEGVAEEVVAEEVVATSEAEMNASQDQPKSQRIKHTARKNVHYVRRSTRQRL